MTERLHFVAFSVISYYHQKILTPMTRFENLSEILDNNPKLRDDFFQKFQGKEEYLSNLDNIFSFFMHTHRIALIAKIKDTNTLDKFNSLIAELISAKVYAQRGCEINLLPDDFSKSTSPDILCRCHDFLFYVEVTRLSDSEPTLKIIDGLRELLLDKPFVVSVKFNDILSQPCFSGAERRKQEILLEKSMRQFKKELESLTSEASDHELTTDCIIFSISSSAGKPGFPGSFVSHYKFPEELFEKYVTFRLVEKAKKRIKFEGSARNYPYILTFVSENISVDDIDFKDLLYGCTTEISIFPSEDPKTIHRATIWRDKEWGKILQDKNKHIPKWQDIEAAANSGWNDFLTEIHYIPNDYTYLAKEGLFLTDPLMKNVSGIMLIRKSIESHFYPNPFCDHEISIVSYQEFFNSF
jgi:hypothetical protein